MTDAKFKQLVNSFLDREISQKDHLLLAREVASSAERKAEFERYRRLHAAERQALARMFATGSAVGATAGVAAAEGGGGISEERRAMAEALKARAARAWSEVQLLAVERKKRMLLIVQFGLAAVSIGLAAVVLCRQSMRAIPGSNAYRKEAEALNTESAHLKMLRERLRARQSIAIEWVNNDRGEPVALVGRSTDGGVFVLTHSQLPRLTHSELAVLMEQFQSSQDPVAIRSRFIVSTQAAANVLPEVNVFFQSRGKAALQAQGAASLDEENPFAAFTSGPAYHSEISTTRAAVSAP